MVTAAGVSCAPQYDLQAIQKYAQTTAEAQASFSTVASDYYTSCLRRRELKLPPKLWTFVLVQPLGAPTATPQPLPSSPSADPDCRLANRVSVAWDSSNKIVLGYVQALGAVASVDVRPTFAPLTSALVSAKVLAPTDEAPLLSLADQLSGVIISGELRADIAQTVKVANPSMKRATDALQTFAQNYHTYLNSEFFDTQVYYQSLILSECKRFIGSQRGGSAKDAEIRDCAGVEAVSSRSAVRWREQLLALRDRIYLQRQRYLDRLSAINQNLAAEAAYAAAVQNIEKTHEDLFGATQRGAAARDYLGILQKDVMPLYQNVEDLKGTTK
jgi:hypothetical protein